MSTVAEQTNLHPGCEICGKVPTLTLPVRRHRGLVFIQEFHKIKAPMCQTHGVATTRAFLKRTLVEGWWGVISFFVNFFVVISDLVVLRRYRALPTPEPKPRTAGEEVEGMWLNDRFERFQHRWFGADGWTDAVANNGVVYSDPPGWR